MNNEQILNKMIEKIISRIDFNKIVDTNKFLEIYGNNSDPESMRNNLKLSLNEGVAWMIKNNEMVYTENFEGFVINIYHPEHDDQDVNGMIQVLYKIEDQQVLMEEINQENENDETVKSFDISDSYDEFKDQNVDLSNKENVDNVLKEIFKKLVDLETRLVDHKH